MQQRRGPIQVGGRRRRTGSEDPKYGSKGRLGLAPKLLMALLLLVLGACIGYLGAASRSRATLRAATPAGEAPPLSAQRGPVLVVDEIKSPQQQQQQPPQQPPQQQQQPPQQQQQASATGKGPLAWQQNNGDWVGYVRLPQIPPGARTTDDGKLHIIFSSGCNYFQHWQSEFLLASALLAGQRGRITRIVSGCTDKEAETVAHSSQTFPSGKNDLLVPLPQLNRSVNDYFGLYITPAFDGARDFPWINKPSSIDFFMQHARPELDRLGETVVAILDPDFVFIKPLTQTGLQPGDYIASRGHDAYPGVNNPPDVVRKGRPVAQRYGLEGGWVNPRKYNLQKITGETNPVASTWTAQDAARWTSVGPPLMLHVDDITALSRKWEQYMRPVLDVGKDILADMWAYSIGAAQLDLKHTILDHYMISTWGNSGEAFAWVDAWQSMSCRNPVAAEGQKSPTFIHMASNFKAPGDDGPWMFHKGHVPATILDCDTPLIKESPDDLFDITKGRHQRQRAWVLCNVVSRLNKVLLMYKQKFCPVGFEQRKLVRLIQRKDRDRSCSERRDKWCFPLAQIEDLPADWRETM